MLILSGLLFVVSCSHYSSRRYATSNLNITINHCSFIGITDSNNGGALNVDTTSESCFVFNCVFERISGNDGGAVYISAFNAFTKNCMFAFCNGHIGSCEYTIANGGNNQINASVFDSCVASNCCGWIFKYGQCLAFMINSTRCYCPNREPTGHFGWAPPFAYGLHLIFIHNTGKSVFSPQSSNLDVSLFESMIFSNNTSMDLGVINVYYSQCNFICCLFSMNTGIIFSHTLNQMCLFLNCAFLEKTYPTLLNYSNCEFFVTQSMPLLINFPSQCLTFIKTNTHSTTFYNMFVSYLSILLL